MVENGIILLHVNKENQANYTNVHSNDQFYNYKSLEKEMEHIISYDSKGRLLEGQKKYKLHLPSPYSCLRLLVNYCL